MEEKIYIVEDNEFYSTILREELRKRGIKNLTVFNDPTDFLQNLHTAPSIVLLDHQLGELNGIDILKKIKSFNPNIQVIILSGQDKLKVAVTSLKYGAYDYVEKNEGAINRIVFLIKRINHFKRVTLENRQYRNFKRGLFAGIAAMFAVLIYLNIKHPIIFNM